MVLKKLFWVLALKVLWKNVLVVSLYTRFRGSLFFPKKRKNVLRDEEFVFTIKPAADESISHYSCGTIRYICQAKQNLSFRVFFFLGILAHIPKRQ